MLRIRTVCFCKCCCP